ncbi:MAG: CSLREA domain-containing protein [bacterium]|nr:CSLREA domain-containing protein [bacterium]
MNATRLLVWGSFLVLTGLLVCAPAAAATITVNTTADQILANGVCSLREAIRNSNADADVSGGDCAAGSGGDVIQVQPGTINLSIPNVGGSEDFNQRGDLDITDDVQIIGTPGGATTIDASAVSDRVLHVVSPVRVVLEYLTLRGGVSGQGGGLRLGAGSDVALFRSDVIDNSSTLVGGGIANLGGTLRLDSVYLAFNDASSTGGGAHSTGDVFIADSLVEGNDASSGGGVYIAGGDLDVSDTEFESNTASSAGGGLIAVNLGGTATVTGGSFFDNQAPTGAAMQFNVVWDLNGTTVRDNTATSGGAIRSRQNGSVDNATFLRNLGGVGGAISHEVGTLDIEDSVFTDNRASSGGAINNTATLHLTRADFVGNDATAGVGGALRNTDDLTLSRCTVRDGTATVSGGGIYDDGGQTTISYSTVSGNTAQGSGGGVMAAQLQSDVTLFNSTVSDNLAGDFGGGVYVGGDVTIDFSTIADNRANQPGFSGGGAYLAGGLIEIKNTILALNSPQNCGGNGTGSVTSYGYNLADDACAVSGPGDAINTNPQLLPLGDNGGATETHGLDTNSPARDSAAPGCLRIVGGAAPNDQRLMPRPVEGDGAGAAECDRGALEGANPFSVQPLPVGDGSFAPPMLASKNPGNSGKYDITWDAVVCLSQDYHLIYGPLTQVSNYQVTGSLCNLGQAGTLTAAPLPSGDLWFLILANDDFNVEGSWGQATSGERNGTFDSGECGMTQRDNTATCP